MKNNEASKRKLSKEDSFSEAMRTRIKRLYKEKDYSLSELTRVSGIPYSTLNSFMNRQSNSITVSTLDKICKGLGITLADFFDDDELFHKFGPKDYKVL